MGLIERGATNLERLCVVRSEPGDMAFERRQM